MNSKALYLTIGTAITRIGMLVVMLFAWLPLAGSSTAQARGLPEAASAPANSLLQFKSGGHLVAFQADKVYLAGLDHAISFQFVGGTGVLPQASAGAPEGAPALNSVMYTREWDGIDITYQTTPAGIAESTYTLAPGADVSQIRLRCNVPVEQQKDGSLAYQLASQSGSLSEAAPVAWQEIDGSRKPVAVRFALAEGNLVGFQLGAYDPHYALTIDPTYQWHTFMGSEGYLTSRAVAVDADGSIYLLGETPYDLWAYGDRQFVAPVNDSGHEIGTDIVVVKLDSSGGYLWRTFYGGEGAVNVGSGIALDGSGNVYVTGWSNKSWYGPASSNHPIHAYRGGTDLFVLKLSKDGAYDWHTFYGAPQSTYAGSDASTAIAVDSVGHVYITGTSDSSWTGDDPVANTPKHAFTGQNDIFVLKLTTNGVYQWHTFWGSDGVDCGNGIKVDQAGNVYVAGYVSGAINHATSWHDYVLGDGRDMIVLQLNTSGDYQWHTIWGGPGDDFATAIALENSSAIYVTGSSSATWQGKNNKSPIHSYTGGTDIVALRLTTVGDLSWHTFYGSAGNDAGTSIAASAAGDVYIIGDSYAAWKASLLVLPQRAYQGGTDLALVKLDDSGAYQWHAFYGSKFGDSSAALALDPGGNNLYITGNSMDSWGVALMTPALNLHTGGNDLFMLKVGADDSYAWHTFYGGQQNDSGNAIAVDASGNVYIAGIANAGSGNPKHAFPVGDVSGLYHILVVKLDSSGNYVWHTYFGSSTDIDEAFGIAVDQAGNIVVMGDSYATWQVDANTPPKHAFQGGHDLLVLKLHPNGDYWWHTFYGKDDEGSSIAVDINGAIYVTGSSDSSWQGDQNTDPKHLFAQVAGQGSNNIVILKLAGDGSYLWHTFYGAGSQGGGSDGYAIAVDGNGSVYVTGDSRASWQGDRNSDPEHAFNDGGSTNLFVMKLTTGGVYQWHTFYASNHKITSTAISLDPSDNLYITGISYADWPVENRMTPKHAYGGGEALFVLKLDGDGHYLWHTFYGGGAYDYGLAIAVNRLGDVYVAGLGESSWGSPLHQCHGGVDIEVLKLNTNGSYLWHTYYGSDSNEFSGGIALNARGDVLIGGSSEETWQGDNNAKPQNTISDGRNLTVLKLSDPITNLFLPFVHR